MTVITTPSSSDSYGGYTTAAEGLAIFALTVGSFIFIPFFFYGIFTNFMGIPGAFASGIFWAISSLFILIYWIVLFAVGLLLLALEFVWSVLVWGYQHITGFLALYGEPIVQSLWHAMLMVPPVLLGLLEADYSLANAVFFGTPWYLALGLWIGLFVGGYRWIVGISNWNFRILVTEEGFPAALARFSLLVWHVSFSLLVALTLQFALSFLGIAVPDGVFDVIDHLLDPDGPLYQAVVNAGYPAAAAGVGPGGGGPDFLSPIFFLFVLIVLIVGYLVSRLLAIPFLYASNRFDDRVSDWRFDLVEKASGYRSYHLITSDRLERLTKYAGITIGLWFILWYVAGSLLTG